MRLRTWRKVRARFVIIKKPRIVKTVDTSQPDWIYPQGATKIEPTKLQFTEITMDVSKS